MISILDASLANLLLLLLLVLLLLLCKFSALPVLDHQDAACDQIEVPAMQGITL